ncbi:MAG TPA: hypothetical protein VGK73_31110 [Polyangiaceae bacterium]
MAPGGSLASAAGSVAEGGAGGRSAGTAGLSAAGTIESDGGAVTGQGGGGDIGGLSGEGGLAGGEAPEVGGEAGTDDGGEPAGGAGAGGAGGTGGAGTSNSGAAGGTGGAGSSGGGTSGGGNGGCAGANLSVDREHCGDCETRCDDTEICAAGECVTSPCAGLCLTRELVPMKADGWRADNIGTLAKCFEVSSYTRPTKIPSIICWEFEAGRTLAVNGTTLQCTGVDETAVLPEPRAGGYCVQVGNGGFKWSGFKLPLP